MKKLFYIMMACLTLAVLPSCKDKDQLEEDIDSLKAALAALQPEIDNLNTQVNSYLDLVKGNIFVSSFTRAENGDYVLTLSDGTTFTVYSGKPSEVPPVVSIDAEGFWCYQWGDESGRLTDKDGNPVPALPTDAPDGKTPKIQINAEGYWQYSFDGGKTWETIGGEVQVSNPTLCPGSLFESVTPSEDNSSMAFKMAGTGEVITVPLFSNMTMTFAYDENQMVSVAKGGTATIQATLTNVKNLVVENTVLKVSVDEAGLVTVGAPADAPAGSQVVLFRIVDANHYAKLVKLYVLVTE